MLGGIVPCGEKGVAVLPQRPRSTRRPRSSVVAGFMVLCLTLPMPSVAQEIRGNAKVVSGNQIIVGKRTVRLFGIAAPGLEDICTIRDVKMRCGIVAWSELIKLADGQYLSCDIEKLPPDKPVAAESPKPEEKPVNAIAAESATTPDPAMKYATCYIGETDLNEALVRSGWAKTVLSQTDRYQVDETDARESKRGLWANSAKSKKKRRKKR